MEGFMSHNAYHRRRGIAVGLGIAAGAVLAAGLIPLAAASPGRRP
ncbi:putative membrane protein [Mycobacterium xenopi 4042]|uniref:Putative membrane protein n=1 Tax=Mycobacterium xenopi 4042 TaxID=1299334 RepID=X8AR76_MYCXE|nr:putative membrane protein [Mycobacterium xenopi 4042]